MTVIECNFYKQILSSQRALEPNNTSYLFSRWLAEIRRRCHLFGFFLKYFFISEWKHAWKKKINWINTSHVKKNSFDRGSFFLLWFFFFLALQGNVHWNGSFLLDWWVFLHEVKSSKNSAIYVSLLIQNIFFFEWKHFPHLHWKKFILAKKNYLLLPITFLLPFTKN